LAPLPPPKRKHKHRQRQLEYNDAHYQEDRSSPDVGYPPYDTRQQQPNQWSSYSDQGHSEED
jgi:hypothetical protein